MNAYPHLILRLSHRISSITPLKACLESSHRITLTHSLDIANPVLNIIRQMTTHNLHHQYSDRRFSLFLLTVSTRTTEILSFDFEVTYVAPQLNRLFGLAGSPPTALCGLSFFVPFSFSFSFSVTLSAASISWL